MILCSIRRAAGALLLAVVLAACGEGTGAPAPASPAVSAAAASSSVSARPSGSSFPTPAAPAPVASTPAAAPTKFTTDNWGQLAFEATRSDLSQYKGVAAEVSGQVFNVESDATRVAVQMYVYPLRGEGNTVVVFTKAGNPAVAKGDTIQVVGTLDGELVRKTDQGQTLYLPRVAATSVTIPSKASANASAGPSRAASTSASASAAASAAAASGTANAGDFFAVTGTPATGLNVRTAPNTTAARKGMLHNNDVVKLVAAPSAGWVQIQGADFSGYVSFQFLAGPSKVSNPQLAKLSPITK